MLVIVACLFIATVNLGMSQRPAVPAIVALVVSYALSILAYWFPLPCSLALLAFACIGEYAIPMFGLYDSFFMYLGLGLFAYMTTNLWAAIGWVVMCLYMVVERFLRPSAFTWYGVISFITLYLLLVIMVRGLRWNQERTEQLRAGLQAQADLRIMRANQQTAMQLHDGLSRQLARISLMAQRQSYDGGADAVEWQQVDVFSHEALQSLRDVIRLLDQGLDDGAPQALGVFQSQMRQEMREGDQLLHDQGFRGRSRLNVRDAPADIASGSGDVMLMTLHEVFTNISKHGDSSIPYTVTVSIGPDRICLDYRNGIGEDAGRETLEGGNGLALTHGAVHDAGGTVTHQVQESTWKGRVVLPLSALRPSA
ncbi:MAG: hypothetical protein UHD09_01305 [Bifidobacterium sp.]|nr:hypothetical protein [Bifidobacterium sp.]